jgi:hypothetical protein
MSFTLPADNGETDHSDSLIPVDPKRPVAFGSIEALIVSSGFDDDYR